jgi:hypothetical protein
MSPALTQPRPPQIHEYEHLGTYLRDLRRYYNLQVNDVAQRIHIRAKYIQAIEDQKPELLPGKVYARGYIATYAEFLGLEPESFTERYLGQEVKPPVESRFFVPEPKRKQFERKATKHPPYWIFACAALLVGAYLLMPASSGDPSQDTDVEAVPERLAGRLRNALMPTPDNFACLTGGRVMACVTQRLGRNMTALPLPEVPYQWRHASDVVREEKARKAAAEAAAKREMEAEEVIEAPPAPKPAAPAPKPEAKKPQVKAPVAKAPEIKKTAPKPTATTAVKPTIAATPLPWMKASEAANMAPAAAPKAKTETPAADATTPPSYRDPNAVDELFPRRTRR